ncbi:hypothetical protein BJ165DRAFT_1409766 [Panaeolus papilionaceus]|nr:hypothetical protein BJ165DRAFT_1409766 [Panaeolus papilionaceus]
MPPPRGDELRKTWSGINIEMESREGRGGKLDDSKLGFHDSDTKPGIYDDTKRGSYDDQKNRGARGNSIDIEQFPRSRSVSNWGRWVTDAVRGAFEIVERSSSSSSPVFLFYFGFCSLCGGGCIG